MLTQEEIQDKIDYEIVVDCYDDYEVAIGWLTTMGEEIVFPFTATAELKKKDGSTEHKTVQIVGLESDEDDFHGNDFLLNMEIGEYVVPVAFSQLTNIVASEETLELFQCWNHWIKK
ncbi:MAG: calcium-binding protein [Arcicella sp.]|nr:calcium-binding protein [Arcicella sp.]